MFHSTGPMCSNLWLAPGLIHKHYTRLERPARDKHSSLVQTFVNYGRKKFYKVGPLSLFDAVTAQTF